MQSIPIFRYRIASSVYKYMLQHGLYDVEIAKMNRNSGSYVTYINGYNAPYLFVSATGTVSDYTTLMHELGHFTDAFINCNSKTSIDQSEISSQALSYLMLTKMEAYLSSEDMKYLIETTMLDAIFTLIIQGFYAKVYNSSSYIHGRGGYLWSKPGQP